MAQARLIVGDLAANSDLVLAYTAEAARNGCQLVVFPEMTLTGYPPEDLVLRRSFGVASRTTLAELAAGLAEAGLADIAVIVGYLDHSDGARNAAAFIQNGTVVRKYFKHHLPNYGVFDEMRYFRPGTELPVIRFGDVDIAMTICEDVWQDGGPFGLAAAAGVGLLLCINGSPYERGKDDLRLALVARRALEAGCPVVFVNQVGGQDELVFDGDSFIVDATGRLIHRAPQFAEGLFYADVEAAPASSQALPGTDELWVSRLAAPLEPRAGQCQTPQCPIATPLPDEAEVWTALVTGTRDYALKNGFSSAVLGLSGGIDSAVVAAIAADAIGGWNVHGIGMPSAYSSDHSLADAADLADRIGASYEVVQIEPMVRAFVAALSLTGLAEENVQARVRGTTLMGSSNQHGHLVLATGNKSELAVGYSTIYGDAVGGFAPIKDVPKSLVWRLARWRNDEAARRGQRAPIPENSISKPPSAELRPGQLDSDSLPDYELLDAILLDYVDSDASFDELVSAGFDAELVARVVRMVDAAEWKRRQYPPGPKISLKAFGRDRRLPISNAWRETARDVRGE
jgi:NAD+ synthase (glutamine-hydrolysing)